MRGAHWFLSFHLEICVCYLYSIFARTANISVNPPMVSSTSQSDFTNSVMPGYLQHLEPCNLFTPYSGTGFRDIPRNNTQEPDGKLPHMSQLNNPSIFIQKDGCCHMVLAPTFSLQYCGCTHMSRWYLKHSIDIILPLRLQLSVLRPVPFYTKAAASQMGSWAGVRALDTFIKWGSKDMVVETEKYIKHPTEFPHCSLFLLIKTWQSSSVSAFLKFLS